MDLRAITAESDIHAAWARAVPSPAKQRAHKGLSALRLRLLDRVEAILEPHAGTMRRVMPCDAIEHVDR